MRSCFGYCSAIFIVFSAAVLWVAIAPPLLAGPQSSTYELRQYEFGAGGTATSEASSYALFGTAGESAGSNSLESATYSAGFGLIFTQQAGAPPTPSFSNPNNLFYDRLQVTIQPGTNPSDAQYVIALSSDNWTTTQYVQNDYTVGPALGIEDVLPYSGIQGVGWGGSGGFLVTGLSPETQYRVKVKVRLGRFTESVYSQEAIATTTVPSLSFSASNSQITFANLNDANSFTDTSQTTTFTTSTNAYNGYAVFGYMTQPLTSTAYPSETIAHYAASNSSPTTWTGTGLGYSTDDSDLTGGTPNRFTSGGPKYAGFTSTSPGDPLADHAGPVTTPISNEQFTVSYRLTANNQTKAGVYTSAIRYIIIPLY